MHFDSLKMRTIFNHNISIRSLIHHRSLFLSLESTVNGFFFLLSFFYLAASFDSNVYSFSAPFLHITFVFMDVKKQNTDIINDSRLEFSLHENTFSNSSYRQASSTDRSTDWLAMRQKTHTHTHFNDHIEWISFLCATSYFYFIFGEIVCCVFHCNNIWFYMVIYDFVQPIFFSVLYIDRKGEREKKVLIVWFLCHRESSRESRCFWFLYLFFFWCVSVSIIFMILCIEFLNRLRTAIGFLF